MNSLFEINGFKNNKKITRSVYGVRTSLDSKYEAEFLVYYQGRWIWINSNKYTPIDRKHSWLIRILDK